MNYELWAVMSEGWLRAVFKWRVTGDERRVKGEEQKSNYELWIRNYELWIMNYERWWVKGEGGRVIKSSDQVKKWSSEEWRGDEVWL